MGKEGVSARERLFCWQLASCGSAEEAAEKAGFEKPAEQAVKLLMRVEIRRECRRAALELADLPGVALRGLERLAFGSAADAVGLVFRDEDAYEARLSGLDLFCVSEIKRPKGGGLEVKLYDRQRALEALLEHSGGEAGAYRLYNALENNAGNGDANDV